MLLLGVKPQSGVAYKSVAYKKAYNIVLQSFKCEIFFYDYPVFHWGDISKRVLSGVGGKEKRHKGGGVGIGAFRVEVVYRRGAG